MKTNNLTKVRAVACVAMAFAGVFASTLAARGEYVPVAYIEATGKQWINTGYTPACTDRFEMKIRFNNIGYTQCLFCSRGKDLQIDTLTSFLFDKKVRIDRNSAVCGSIDLELLLGIDYTLVADFGRKTATLSNWKESASISTMKDGDFTPGSPLTLFASHTSGTDLSASSTMSNWGSYRLYYFKVYNADGTLVHSYVPVEDTTATDSKKRYGLYDTVGETFCANNGSVGFTVIPTLTWTGLAGDGKFTSVGNWTSDGSSAINFSHTNNYRFVDVANNTTITIPSDAEIIHVNDVTVSCATDAARSLTITGGKDFQNLSTATFFIQSNCVLNVSAQGIIRWSSIYNGCYLVGGGTIKYTNYHEGWGGEIKNYSSTFVIGFRGDISRGFSTLPVNLSDSDAVVELSCDAWAAFMATVPGSKIKLNNHCLYDLSLADNASYKTLAAEISGTDAARLVLMGSVEKTLTTNATMNGTYEIRNTSLKLGKSADEPATIPSDSIVDLYSHGSLKLCGSQQLGVLKGDGAIGYASIPDGKTLTVGGRDDVTSSTFAGRLSGKGDFVKKGTDYRLAMSGDSSDFSGNVSVSEGTLELKRPVVCSDDIVVYWPFEGESRDLDTVSGITFARARNYRTMYTAYANGALGEAVWFENNPSVSNHVATTVKTGAFPADHRIDGTNFTLSVWLKPNTNVANHTTGRFLQFGGYPESLPSGLDYNMCMLEYYNDGASEQLRTFTFHHPKLTIPPEKTMADGKWHHFAYVHSAHQISFWLDGELGVTYTNNNVTLYITDLGYLQLGGMDAWDNGYGYNGGLDELIIANGQWSEQRIRREYNRLRDTLDAKPLPTPAAKWTFDNGLVDEIGNVELVSGEDAVAVKSLTGANGKGIDLANYKRWLKLKNGSAYPFPTGKMPFTVSMRVSQYGSSDYSHVFSFGNTTNANEFFAMGFNGSRRPNSAHWTRPGEKYVDWNAYDQSNLSGCNSYSWDHMVATYDGVSTMRFYRDGRLLDTKTSVALNLSDGPFYLGYYENHPSITATTLSPRSAGAYVDDFRVWTNCCLNASQVATLARTLDGRGVSGQFTNSTVTVSAGAKLVTTGSGNEVKSLSGTGTLEIVAGSSFAAGTLNFTGEVAGAGRMDIPNGANLLNAKGTNFIGTIKVNGGAATLNNTFTNCNIVLNGGTATGAAADIAIAEGTTIAVDGNHPTAPKITTTGRLVLPETLTVTVSPTVEGEVIVATAGTVVMPASTAKWNLPAGFRVRNKNGKFRLVSRIGSALLLW